MWPAVARGFNWAGNRYLEQAVEVQNSAPSLDVAMVMAVQGCGMPGCTTS